MKPVKIQIVPNEGLVLSGGYYSERVVDDLRDCHKSGDCEPAIEYFIKKHKPVFYVGATIATDDEMRQCAENIYYDSEQDFSNREIAEKYLVWELAGGEYQGAW